MTDEIITAEYSEEALTLLAKAFVPEIQAFYKSAKVKLFFNEWLDAHPEYQDKKMIA